MVGTLLAQTLSQVHHRIEQAAVRAGRNPSDVTLIGVTKTHPVALVEAAMKAGLHDIGENYVQEALEKKKAISASDIRWHFIGHLQSNKVKLIVGSFDLIHSVDRVSLAEEISKRARAMNLVQPLLLQVKIGGEESKGGFDPSELTAAVEFVLHLPNIRVQGLMTVPAPSENPEEIRAGFRQMAELKRDLDRIFDHRDRTQHPLRELSMGMSSDFEIAIEEGATLIRLGTVLFGSRAAR